MINPRIIGYQENVEKTRTAGRRKNHPVRLFVMHGLAVMKNLFGDQLERKRKPAGGTGRSTLQPVILYTVRITKPTLFKRISSMQTETYSLSAFALSRTWR